MDARKLLEQLDSAMSQLTVLRDLILSAQLDPAPNIAVEEAARICHFCKKPLGVKKPTRGIHPACNQEITRAISRGEVTDAQLMAAGRIGPRKPPGRKRKTAIQDLIASQANATEQADLAAKPGRKKQSTKGATTS